MNKLLDLFLTSIINLFVIGFAVVVSFLFITFSETVLLMIYLNRINLHDYDASYLQPINIVILLLLSLILSRKFLKSR